MNSGILLHQPQGCQGVCLKNAQDLGLGLGLRRSILLMLSCLIVKLMLLEIKDSDVV